MYTVESLNNSFIIKNNGVPLFGGSSNDYYVKKDDVFSLSVISLTNEKDRFKMKIEEAGKSTIKELFADVVDALYGVKVGDAIRNLNSTNEFYLSSIGNVFVMARCNMPYYCGPRNNIIVRTDSRKTYMYNRQTLEVVQVLDVKDTGKDTINELFDEIVEAGNDEADSRGLNYIGTWDANTNTPDISATAPVSGDYYKVSIAGSTDIDGITDWKAGDWLIFNGNVWEKVDQTESVASVNGKVGTVVIGVDDIDNLSGVNTGDEVQATEAVLGIAEIATQTEVHAGTDDLRMVTPLKLESEKNIADGIAGLDEAGKLSETLLPFVGGSKSSIVSFGSDSKYTVNSTSASYKKVATFIYAGTNDIGPVLKFRINAWRSGGTGASFRIYDPKNNKEIAEITNITSETEDNIEDMGTVSNLPTGVSIFELQIKRNGNGATGYCGSLEMIY